MSDKRYLVLMGQNDRYSPAMWLDGSDGRNERGFYFGGHATTFRSLDIAKRRVRWSRELDKKSRSERWGYKIQRLKSEEDR